MLLDSFMHRGKLGKTMIAYTPVARPLPRGLVSPKLVFMILALLFAILVGWTARSLSAMKPVPVVPCRTCAEKCSCPRLTGTIRCGCPQ